MNKEAIKKALDFFETDKYVDAKEIIQREISGKRDVFLKDKLGLSNDINPAPVKPEESEEDGVEGDE